MTVMFNLGSIVLGLWAWIIPSIVLIKRNKFNKFYSILSFVLCICALLCQFLEINRLVKIEDFSAIADTIGAIVQGAIIFTVVTIILNVAAAIKK